MAKFNFAEGFNVNQIFSAKLSALAADTPGLAAGFLTDADIGKGVKLGAADRYVLAVTGDEIEGFLVALESATVDGYSFGSIARAGYKSVTFEGAGITPGSFVTFGVAIAKGTALTVPVAVKVGTAVVQSASKPFAYNPSTHVWRVIGGTGVAGTVGVIERVGVN